MKLAACLLSATGLVSAAAGASPAAVGSGASAIVIAHRGASAYRPEHTLAAYALAAEQGADFIEPDLVVTRDGVLIARHENALSGTTNVAEVADFADRRVAKRVDGEEITDWFAEDFTLAEIKRLRARERIPAIRPRNAAYDDRFEIPTLREVIRLVERLGAESGRPLGLYPEIKHPAYFAYEGAYRDGRPIRRNLGRLLVRTLLEEGFTDPGRVYIQSFELASLIELDRRWLPEAGIELPLIQLFGDLDGRYVNDQGGGFSRPYDLVYNIRTGGDLAAIYGKDLAAHLEDATGYGDLLTGEIFALIARYAAGIGPWKDSILLREPVSTPANADGAGRAGIGTRLTGRVGPILGLAREHGLAVHPYTLRPEERFQSLDKDGTPLSQAEEMRRLLSLGATGLFTDDPLTGRRVVDDRGAASPGSDDRP
jgi:glycerophosphoryl diester phosphodiesterase